MEIDREALLRVFSAESEDGLGEMEDVLLELEQRPDPEGVHTVFRLAHTLKGNAASLGFDELAALAHVAEDLLDRLRAGALRWTASMVTLVLRAVDALRDLLRRSLAAETETPDTPATPGATSPGRAEPETVRVDVVKLDRMLDLTGEITVARERSRQILGAEGSPAAIDAHLAADGLFLSLQEEIRRARMVSLGPTLRRLSRVVRDLSAAHGKEASLVIEGGDVELDLRIAEQIRDPLTHVVRNAIDHGIEAPDARQALGKPRAGTIAIRAFADAGSMVVEVVDDGAGMDRGQIHARAVENGLIAPRARLTDEQILDLVFRPGFSTATEVTELSGRGVGMDIVRRNVEALRGTARIESVEGRGTTLRLRVPLTLALIEGFSVRAGGETFVIPMDAVMECALLEGAKPGSSGAYGVFPARGALLPFVRIRSLFGTCGAAPPREEVVIVRHAGGALGLVVDALEGTRTTVVKPLAAPCRAGAGVSGTALLGDGGVALILDVPSLVRMTLRRPEASTDQGAPS